MLALQDWRRAKHSLFRFLDRLERPLVGIAAILALSLGIIGFGDQPGLHLTVLDRVYKALQLFPLEYREGSPSVWELQVARFLAPAVTVYAAALALSALLREELDILRARLVRNHVVVCGLGRCGVLAAQGLRLRGYQVVAVDRNKESAAITEVRRAGITVIHGDATDRLILERARLRRAAWLVVFCGSDDVNAEVVGAARTLTGGRSRPLRSVVGIADFELGRILEEVALADHSNEEMRIEFLNVAMRGATALLNTFPLFGQSPEGECVPHLLVVGIGEMGGATVALAARRWAAAGSARPLFVTIVDQEAAENERELALRHPALRATCDLKLVQLNVKSVEYRQCAFLDDRPPVTTAYICLGNDAQAVTAGLTLRRVERVKQAQIVVRTTIQPNLTSLIEADARVSRAGGAFRTFDVLDSVCDSDQLLTEGPYERLARELHLLYVESRLSAGETPETNTSTRPWEELSESLREANRRQAEHLKTKLEAVDCDILTLADWTSAPVIFSSSEIERMAELEHERWCEERRIDGWTYGAERDELNKRTPYLIDWVDLADEIKQIDREFVQEIPRLAERSGFVVTRQPGAGV